MTPKRIYISFNRAKIDTDTHNDEEFLKIVKANIEHAGHKAVGDTINDSQHLEQVIRGCDEVWQCLRCYTDESSSTRYELPGALMCTEKRMAEHLGLPINERSFIFKF